MKKAVTTRTIAIALGAISLTLAVGSSAGAGSPKGGAVSSAATSNALAAASSLPTTTISGSPPAFTPTTLMATAAGGTCRPSVPQFKVDDRESVNEHVRFKSGGVWSSFTILAGGHVGVCVQTGFTGTITLKLSDRNKAHVIF
jgi:hypothetical protein